MVAAVVMEPRNREWVEGGWRLATRLQPCGPAPFVCVFLANSMLTAQSA